MRCLHETIDMQMISQSRVREPAVLFTFYDAFCAHSGGIRHTYRRSHSYALRMTMMLVRSNTTSTPYKETGFVGLSANACRTPGCITQPENNGDA
jgi:hypothetical protein